MEFLKRSFFPIPVSFIPRSLGFPSSANFHAASPSLPPPVLKPQNAFFEEAHSLPPLQGAKIVDPPPRPEFTGNVFQPWTSAFVRLSKTFFFFFNSLENQLARAAAPSCNFFLFPTLPLFVKSAEIVDFGPPPAFS